jgi:Tol biopolymer transport system component
MSSLKTSRAPVELAALGDGVEEVSISSIGQLALVHEAEDSNIWMLNVARGTASRTPATPKLILASTRMEESPSVRDDSQQIAFASNRAGYQEIWTARIDGSDVTQVTYLQNPVTGSPDWSPDGRIVFDSRAGGRPQLYIMSADGGKAALVSSSVRASVVPHWSHDGSQIYFSSDRSGRMEIWRVPPNGGEPVQITKNGGFAAIPDPEGKFIYYTNDNAAVSPLWRLDLQSGTRKLISSSVLRRAYAPARGGLYFFTGSNNDERSSLYWYDNHSEHPTLVFTTDRRIGNGITLAPDEHALFYTQLDTSDRQLLLVQNFWK